MAIGVSSYAYRWAVRTGQMDVFALLDRAREAGAGVVQICDNLPLDGLADGTLADFARHGADLGLALEVGIKGSRPEYPVQAGPHAGGEIRRGGADRGAGWAGAVLPR